MIRFAPLRLLARIFYKRGSRLSNFASEALAPLSLESTNA